MAGSMTYERRRGELETYFDRTAVDAWANLTSDAPVSRIRATVRAGRDAMRQRLLDYLPHRLDGARVLDAGCGTGALSIELARRGADVVAIDLSPTLVDLARQRTDADLGTGTIRYEVGDMLAPSLGRFDHVVAMDSLIHYRAPDMVRMVSQLAERSGGSVVFTFAPRTLLLTLMHAVGRLFPRGDRSPAIEPVSERGLRRRIAKTDALSGWAVAGTERISAGFYISQALCLVSDSEERS